jgi:hypothetical protein
MSSSPEGNPTRLSRRYSAALRRQLQLKPGASLRPAESLGRGALAAGLDSLDLAMIHEEALITLLPPGLSSRNSHETIRRGASFLVAALTPIENAHRTALKNSAA